MRSSGYLITFYVARARRILPALAVMVVILLAVGWWTLGPADYEQLATHVHSAVTFVSNHRFLDEAGYFDVASHEKWLLHTWSLSIEWQFYLLLPAVMMATWKILPSRRWLILIVTAAFFASLFWSSYLTGKSPETAFYLLPSRAWELLAGGLVYLVSDKVHLSQGAQRLTEYLGLALIAVSLVVFDVDTSWPGMAAALPVLGTSLVLLATRETPKWAISKPIQWLGKSSYSLYLWHWPAFVALVYLDYQNVPFAVVAALVVSLALAALSYHCIEQPSRRFLTHLGSSKALVCLFSMVIAIAIAALVINQYHGFSERMPDEFNTIMAETENINPHRDKCHGRTTWDDFPWCVIGGDDIQAIVIGDSHAASIFNAVREAFVEDKNDSVVMATYSGCPTLFEAEHYKKNTECKQFNQFIMKQIDNLPSHIPVIISNRLTRYILGPHLEHEKGFGKSSIYYDGRPQEKPDETFRAKVRDDLIASACMIAENRPVYWLKPTPEMPVDVPRWLARQSLMKTSEPEISILMQEYQKRHAFTLEILEEASNNCGLILLDPTEILCDERRCYGSKLGMPLYYDNHHLSVRGSKKLVPLFSSIAN